MKSLVDKTRKKIADDERYPLEVRSVFTEVVEYEQDALKTEVQAAYLEWMEHNDIGLFYSKYQENVIGKAKELFMSLEFSLAGLMSVKLRDVCAAFLTSTVDVPSSSSSTPMDNPKEITVEEKDGLQKLAGFVLYKTLKNTKKAMKVHPGVLKIVQSMVGSASGQKLIESTSRGKLTAAIDEWNSIIVIAETLFRARTSGGIQSIGINLRRAFHKS